MKTTALRSFSVELVVTQIVPLGIGHECESIGFEGIQRVVDFFQRAVHVRERKGGEESEFIGILATGTCDGIVGFACDLSRNLVGFVVEMGSRRGNAEN